MELFCCPDCGARLFFRNLACVCGAQVAWNPDARAFAALADCEPCANRAAIACNWRSDDGGELCRSCAMTQTIPDPSIDDNAALWSEAEGAKRWVLANLMRWDLFTPADPHPAPVFEMLAEETRAGETPVQMGHLDGVVTINVAEADPAVREARRSQMAERFRTMTGHIRHELGHLVFAQLRQVDGFLEAFRPLFGDEREDYAAAIEAHYANKSPEDAGAEPPPGHLTDYAAAHPHEDWAETFAHFLHLVDIVDSAARIDLSSPALAAAGGGDFDPYALAGDDPDAVLTVGAELSVAFNHVNHSMGLSDLYPFVLTPPTRRKLAFVGRWIRRAGAP